MKTDIERVKNIATMFLYMPIRETKFSPMIVDHPYFESAYNVDTVKNEDKQSDTKIVNILEDMEALEHIRQRIRGSIAKAKRLEDIEGIISHTYIQQALDLAACRQSAYQLAALGVLISTLKNLARVCNKIQCVGIFGSQLIIIRFCTIAKIYISHLCLTFLKFLPNKICRLNIKRFNRKKPRGFALLNDPRSIFTIFVFHHNGLTCISVFRLI